MFKDRIDAAQQLAQRLKGYQGKNPLVLGIPRGAVPMAAYIAQALRGQMDVVLVRKLRAPHQPELAIGAITETGWTTSVDGFNAYTPDETYLTTEKQRQLNTIEQRSKLYRPLHPALSPSGRIVIVVDDGMATGASMCAALHSVRASQPQKLICAVPVASPEALDFIQPLADEVVCLQCPHNFEAVGQFYQHFPQIEDADIVKMLRNNRGECFN